MAWHLQECRRKPDDQEQREACEPHCCGFDRWRPDDEARCGRGLKHHEWPNDESGPVDVLRSVVSECCGLYV